MRNNAVLNNDRKMTSVFERFLSLWVLLCIIAGILLGKIAPGVAQYLDALAIYVKGAPVVHPHCRLPFFHDVPHYGQDRFRGGHQSR